MKHMSLDAGSTAPDATWRAYLLGLLPALALAAWLFPPEFLAGQGLFFHDGEISRDISGWLFFAHDGWQRPLLYTPWFNYPEGLSIAFTDSVPLMALLFKPIAGLLPEGFHYFGLWHAVALAIQALGAVFLVRSLGCLGALPALLAAAFAVLSPLWLARFGHSALLAQGILLFALGAYFRAQRGRWSANQGTLVLALICQLALLLHPYLLAMCYAIFVAWLIEQWRDERRFLIQLLRLGASVAITLLLAAILGFFGGDLPGNSAYGEQGLSLTSLWCGGYGSPWLTCEPGAGERYAYLGMGALLAIALAVLLQGQRIPAALRRHAGLVLVLLLLAAFAISNRVAVGDHIIASFPLPEAMLPWMGMFEASARFIWPLAYLLTFAALAALMLRGWAGILLVVIALGLQWVDTATRRDEIRIAARLPEPVPDPAWERALRGIAHVSMYPAFGCGDIDPLAYLPVQKLVARQHATLNTAYASRMPSDCDVKHARLQHEIRPGQLVLAPTALPAEGLPQGMRTAAMHGQCRALPIAPVLWGVARPQELLACRAEPADEW
ncbi:MAG: DUF6311 domain-containing protein [Pigmentiphaga sp.]